MKDFVCNVCQKSFNTQHGLKVHQSRTKHRGSERVQTIKDQYLHPMEKALLTPETPSRKVRVIEVNFAVCPNCGHDVLPLLQLLK